MVACAVLIAYISQAIVYLPALRNNFSVDLGSIVARLWPIVPSLLAGWWITTLLPNSFGATFFTLGIRLLFTASVVALVHGLFSRFRCFIEMRGMIWQNVAREVPTL